MKVRFRKTSSAAGVICLCALAYLVIKPQQPEPVYNGKKLSAWIRDLQPVGTWVGGPVIWSFRAFAGSPYSEQNAWEAIRNIGTNGVPLLVRRVRQQDSAVKTNLIHFIRKQSWVGSKIRARLQTSDEKRAQALRALSILGPKAADGWKELLEDRSVSLPIRTLAADSLGQCGQIGLPALERALKDPNRAVCVAAANAVLRHNPGHVPALLSALENSAQSHQASIIWMLGRAGSEPNLVVPVLIGYLDSSVGALREAAADALGKYGSSALMATNRLQQLCHDPKLYVRVAASNALERFNATGAERFAN
jgi:hypothetical protein